MALVAVIVLVAVIGATAADFAYSARLEYNAAIGARDELRAHYLSLSAINLSRLLLRVQQRLIDPNRAMFGGMDVQVADYAPIVMSAFQSKEGAEMLGGLLGANAGDIKGVGVEAGTFDIEMQSLDGRININCGGGPNSGAPAVTRTAAALAALMLPRRYDRLFEHQDAQGQYNDRLMVLRAIIDWADQDLEMYGSNAPEDYRYDTGKDPYDNKNQYFDTLDELRLVRGVDDDFMAAFADQLTVYGSCAVHVGLADAPTIMALIIQYAASTSDPGLEIRNLTLLARAVQQIGQLRGGFIKPQDFVEAVENPMAQLTVAASINGLLDQGQSEGQEQRELATSMPPVTGVKLDPKILQSIVAGSEPRRIWRIVGSADVGQIHKRIVAIWDQKMISMQAGRTGMGPGGYVYWREE